jgi:hypothetical protein
MDSTNRADPPPVPYGRPWVKPVQTGLVVVLTVAVCLIAALGLVVLGFLVVFAFALNNWGSNK